jgi:hypothetical protein
MTGVPFNFRSMETSKDYKAEPTHHPLYAGLRPAPRGKEQVPRQARDDCRLKSAATSTGETSAATDRLAQDQPLQARKRADAKAIGYAMIVAGVLLMAASLFVGYGQYNWWELPVYLLGGLIICAGLAKLEKN